MFSLGDTDYDLDQIDKLYETLESMGIDVTEDFDDDEPIDLDEDIEADLENFESSESMEKALSQEGLMIDDPVKMYLKEIGRVPLLSAEREAELSKRMAVTKKQSRNLSKQTCVLLSALRRNMSARDFSSSTSFRKETSVL